MFCLCFVHTDFGHISTKTDILSKFYGIFWGKDYSNFSYKIHSKTHELSLYTAHHHYDVLPTSEKAKSGTSDHFCIKPTVRGDKIIKKRAFTNSWTLKSLYPRFLDVRKLFKNLKDTVDGTVSPYFLNYQQLLKAVEVECCRKYG